MSIIKDLILEISQLVNDAGNKYVESQKIRAASLFSYKKAGDSLLELQRHFKEGGYCKASPLTLEGVEYTSFHSLLGDMKRLTQAPDLRELPEQEFQLTAYSRKSLQNYMKLSRNWYVVEALNLLEITDCYRLVRTLAVIDWYNVKVEQGESGESLTVELYWQEQESRQQAKQLEREANKIAYEALQQQYEKLLNQLADMAQQNQELSQQLAFYQAESQRLKQQQQLVTSR
jgi:hypothetical protein